MERKLDQRVCLKFCVANGISCSESLRMLRNRFKENCMSKTQAYDWYKSFKAGREFVCDMPRSGRPSTSTNEENIERIKRIVLEHGNISIRKIAAQLNISYGSTKHILAELSGMKRIAAGIAPRILNSLQKDHRLKMAKEMTTKADNDSSFLRRIITGGETWITANELQFPTYPTDNQLKTKNLRERQRENKIILNVFFDYRGLLHYELLQDQDENIDERYYLPLLRRLHDRIREQRPELWETNSFVLHLDSIMMQNSPGVREFITKHSIQIIEQLSCSSDMSPCAFFLYPRLKCSIKERSIDSSEEIKNNLLQQLVAIPSKAYQKCMDDWTKRWKMCIDSNGDYFNIDDIDNYN